MLRHPLRALIRSLIAGERMNVDRLNTVQEELAESGTLSASDLPGSVDCVASLALGAGEGALVRARDLVHGASGEKKGERAHPQTLARKLERGQNRAGSYLTLTGVIGPPNGDEIDRAVDLVVAHAKVNADRIRSSVKASGFPTLDDFAELGQALLGINKGDDRVVHIRVAEFPGKGRRPHSVEIHGFDKRGFHVLEADLYRRAPGVLYVASLRATHGRNVEDLGLDFGGESVPGRGNAALVAAGLEALIAKGAKRGLHTVVTRPGSPMVARLYQKMGFRPPGDEQPFRKRPLEWALEMLPIVEGVLDAVTLAKKELRNQRRLAEGEEPSEEMSLDLSDRRAVHQALACFALSRAGIRDVPKDVARRLRALGEPHSAPALAEYEQSLGEDCPNVRVLRG